MSNSQINRLKSGINNVTKLTLKISSNVVGDSNGENNFGYKLLWTNIQVSKHYKAFANNSSANIKWSKTQLHKTEQLARFSLKPLAKINNSRIRNWSSYS